MPRHHLDRSPTHLLHRAGRCAEAIFESWATSGLTPRQLAVLIAVGQHGSGNQNDVITATGIDRSTTSDIMGRLVRKGLVQRRRSRKDLRAQIVKLTDEGRRVLCASEPLALGVDAQIIEALPETRQEAFLMCLQAIVRRLERGARVALPWRQSGIRTPSRRRA